MLTAATVLWKGNFRKRTYDVDWVYKTRNMLAKNLSSPHEFVCFSNINIPDIKTIPLIYDLPGWFSKLELFSPELSELFNEILFIDLDNLINGELEIEDNHNLILSPGKKKNRYINREGTITYHKYSTQLMYICPGSKEVNTIWNNINFSEISSYRGDQDYINDITGDDIKTFPESWFTRTKYCDEKRPESKIISGNPVKPDEAVKKWEWAKEIWK